MFTQHVFGCATAASLGILPVGERLIEGCTVIVYTEDATGRVVWISHDDGDAENVGHHSKRANSSYPVHECKGKGCIRKAVG